LFSIVKVLTIDDSLDLMVKEGMFVDSLEIDNCDSNVISDRRESAFSPAVIVK
jgi:hypothetical protein